MKNIWKWIIGLFTGETQHKESHVMPPEQTSPVVTEKNSFSLITEVGEAILNGYISYEKAIEILKEFNVKQEWLENAVNMLEKGGRFITPRMSQKEGMERICRGESMLELALNYTPKVLETLKKLAEKMGEEAQLA